MNNSQTSQYFYPNQLGRMILMGMEEVVGRIGVNAVLNQGNLSHLIDNYPPNTMDREFKFEYLGAIQQAFEKIYGVRGGRGLSIRVGRACFKHGLREYGPVLGFTDLAFRLLPLDEKLRTGAAIFAEIFNRFSDQRVVVDEDDECFYWKIERCPVCWGRTSDAPVCHLAVGLLQESLYWVSGGKFYNVEEVECIAMGDAVCCIVVEKKALD